MEQKQRFSLRKYKLGLASVLLGTIFLGGAVTSEVAYAATDSTEDTTQVDANQEEKPSIGKSDETTVTNTEEASTVDKKDEQTASNEVTVSDRAVSTEVGGTTTSSDTAETTSAQPVETSETKNLDNQTPQDKDKLSVESSQTLEKDKNYYEAKDFDGNKVLELNDVTTTKDKNIDLTSDLDKVKALDSATIYLEFKPKEGQSGTYSLFSASSSTNSRSYYTVGVLNGSTPFVGAPNQGSQLYGAELKGGSIDNNGWNAIAVSINRTSNDGAGRIDVYVNGKYAFHSSKNGKFLKDYTDLTNMQLGLMNNGGNNIWGGNVDFRNFTIYNKALTATEVAERSTIFQRDAVSEAVDKDGRVLTAAEKVFTRDQLKRGTFRIPALVKMQDGVLVAGADQRNTGQADKGDIEMVVRTSDDNGKTWGDKVTIFNPQNNPKLGDTNSSNPATMDIALTAKGDKLYAMYDLFPEGSGMATLPSKAVAAYKEIDGKKYQIVTKNGEEYTIRDNGKIFDASGKETAYSVVVDAKDKEHAYQDYGDVYEGSNKIGNILFKTGNVDGFQAVYTSYLMLSESSDNGKTWSAPKNISDMVRSDDMIFQGTGPGAGISLKHGDHAGRIIFPTYTTGLGRGGEHASVVYSDDNGVTWQSSDMIAPNMNNSETTIVELQNGTLKAFMRGYTYVQEATSTDGGATWTNAKNTDRYSNRTQIAATTTIQNGKEYVVLSTPGKTRRVDGIISIGEVQADNSIKWIKERKIVNGIYGYSSIADLGNGEFGILYEHGGEDPNYPHEIYYKVANWKFLTEDALPATIEATKSSLTSQDDVIALSYDEGVVASGNLVLTLSNGHTIEALGQRDANTVLFKWNKDSDQGTVITGVKSGSLDTLDSRNKIDVTASLPYTLTPKESSQVLNFDTYYKGDENLDYGSQKVEGGKVGQKVTRTTYTIDNNGKVIETTVTTTTDPVTKVIIKGTKPTTSTKDTDLGVRYEGDTSLTYGEKTETPGRPKVDTTTTTYEVDARTGNITPTTTTSMTDQGLSKVVKIGTRPTTKDTELPSPIRYEANNDKDFGSENETVVGTTGISTVTTTYTVDEMTGTVTATEGAAVVTKEATPTTIYVGTKPTTATTEVAYTTTYEVDENLAYGASKETRAGVKGENTTTTTYKLAGDHAVVDKVTTTRTKEPVAQVIAVGTKPTVVTEEVAFGTDYVADDNLAYGQTAEVAGKVGTKTITTTYKLANSKAVADKTSAAITVQPVNKLVKVGTKSSTSTKAIAYTTTYEADASRDLNTTAVKTAGEKGAETTTTTYKLEGDQAVVDQVTTAVTKQPVAEVVQIGTKPTVVTEEVAFGTDYEADESLAYGETTEVAGKVGTKAITTTYKLEGSKAVVEKTSEAITVQPVNKIVKVGTKASTSTKDIAYTTTYAADSSRDLNTSAVKTEGEKGIETTTTTYKLEGNKAVVDQVTTAITKQPVAEVVQIGTKPTVVTEEVAFGTDYVADENLAYGQTTEVAGKVGTKAITTTYKLEGSKAVVEKTSEAITVQPVNKIVKVGTKSSTSTKDIAYTTTYEADASRDVNTTAVKRAGEKGAETTTTTYKLEGDKAAVDQVTTAVTKQPVAEVVQVGTKPTVTTEDVAFGTDYVADENLAYGQTEEVAGKVGTKTVTTTYKLDGSKAVIAGTTEETTTKPQNRVVHVGNIQTMETPIAMETTYIADPDHFTSSEIVVEEGQDGISKTTTTYEVNPITGALEQPQTNTTLIKTMIPRVIKRGTLAVVAATAEELPAVEETVQQETSETPFTTTYQADASLDYGVTRVSVAGQTGKKVTTITQAHLNGQVVAEKSEVIEEIPLVNAVILVGTKPTTEVTELASPVEYEADATLAYGQTTEVAGKVGSKTITTTYKLEGSKAVVEKTSEAITVQPVNKIVKVGTKPSTSTKDITYTTTYEADTSRDLNTTAVKTVGEKGVETTTTTYKLEGNKAVVDQVTTAVTKQPVAEVVQIGTKPTVVTEEVAFGTDYVADASLAYGQTAEVAGKVGTKAITTTYKLEGSKAVADNTSAALTVQPVNKIVKVGTQPTVETVEVAYTTSYVADDTLDYGKTVVRTAGTKGVNTTTTTYKLEGDKAVVDKATTVLTTEPTAEVIAVGNVQTTTQPIAIVTRQVNDANLDAGQTRVVEEGKAGVLTTVTTYTVNPTTGALENGQVQTTETVKMVERVVAVGTKVVPTQTTRRVEVRTEVLPFTTERRETAELAKGVEREVQAGVNGSYKVVRDDVYEGDKLVKTGSEYTVDRIAPVTRIIEVGTKEAVIPTPVQPTKPRTVRPATPAEIKRLDELKEQLKERIHQLDVPQDTKNYFLKVVDQAVAKDQLTTWVDNHEVTVSLDNRQTQAERLVVREVEGTEASTIVKLLQAQLGNPADITIYDFHLLDQHDQIVPNNGETRTVTIAIAKSEDEILSVYYINGEQVEEIPSIYQDGQLTFFTDHFSLYSIVRTMQSNGGSTSIPSKEELSPTSDQVHPSTPALENPGIPTSTQATSNSRTSLPNTGENTSQTSQWAVVGITILGFLGFAQLKRMKED